MGLGYKVLMPSIPFPRVYILCITTSQVLMKVYHAGTDQVCVRAYHCDRSALHVT